MLHCNHIGAEGAARHPRSMAAHLKPSERCFCRGRDDRAAMQTLFLAKEREGRARRLYRISDSAAEPRHEIRAVAVRMFDRCFEDQRRLECPASGDDPDMGLEGVELLARPGPIRPD